MWFIDCAFKDVKLNKYIIQYIDGFIVDGLKKKVEFPPPLVVKDSKGKLYLLAGNSRLMLGVAMGYNLPTKVISWSKEIQW